MLIILRQKATDAQLDEVKQYLVEHDLDFHTSTGVNRTILGVIGDTGSIRREDLLGFAGVLEVVKIPKEE